MTKGHLYCYVKIMQRLMWNSINVLFYSDTSPCSVSFCCICQNTFLWFYQNVTCVHECSWYSVAACICCNVSAKEFLFFICQWSARYSLMYTTFFNHTSIHTQKVSSEKKKISDAFVSARKSTISGQHNSHTNHTKTTN